MQDYTINDAYHDGFENGLVYILRYMAECWGRVLTDDEIFDLSCHLDLRKPWRTAEEWTELIRGGNSSYNGN